MNVMLICTWEEPTAVSAPTVNSRKKSQPHFPTNWRLYLEVITCFGTSLAFQVISKGKSYEVISAQYFSYLENLRLSR